MPVSLVLERISGDKLKTNITVERKVNTMEIIRVPNNTAPSKAQNLVGIRNELSIHVYSICIRNVSILKP